MAQNFLQSLIRIYLKFVAKIRSSNEPVDVFSTISRAERVLICLPENLEDFGIARHFTTLFRTNFSHANVIFLVKQNYLNLLNKIDKEKCDILSVNGEHVSPLGLPSKNVIEKIKRMDLDLVIDLNYNFNLTSTYICIISGASLRICLDDKKKRSFFQFSNKNQA